MRQEGFTGAEGRTPESMERFLLNCRQSLQEAGDCGRLAAINNELGAFYQGTGQYEESLRAFQAAGEEIAREHGRNCPEYAAALIHSAAACRMMREGRRAAELLEEALQICRQAGLERSGVYTGVLNSLSAVYREAGCPERSIRYLEEALRCLESSPENRHREIAVTCNNLTALWHAAGDNQEALRCVNRALQAYECLPKKEQARCADILNSLAGFLYAGGDCRRALALYRRSARRVRSFFGENEAYGVTCQNIRWVCEKLGDAKGAAAALAEAERVYRRLLGPDHERTRIVAEDLARMRENSR